MTLIAETPLTLDRVDPSPTASAFRIPNPLRAGMIALFATIAIVGAGMEGLNVALNRGIDAYYGTRIAALAQPNNDPAYAAIREAQAADAASDSATVSAN